MDTGSEYDLKRRLVRFAERECEGRSPLYRRLAQRAAGDEFIIDLLADRRAGQPPGNILLAAVQYLLLSGYEHGLRRFYPNLTEPSADLTEADVEFSLFCRTYEQEIRKILRRRTVGTNEVARAASLYPALLSAASSVGNIANPVHIIEVGSSAGLNLMWDQYAYEYGATARAGAVNSSLVLHCEVPHGRPPLALPSPSVASRRGIDLEPLDIWNEEDVSWLRALIWPEQTARLQRLQRAMEIARDAPPNLLRGDAVEVLPNVLNCLPKGEPVIVFHSFTANQFSERMRDAFAEVLTRASADHYVARVSFEWGSSAAPELRMTTYVSNHISEILLATAEAHGAWLDWCAA